MVTSPSNLHFTSAGFWLPCYQSSFFSRDDDRVLLRPAYALSATSSDLFFDGSEVNESASDGKLPVKLDTTIFSRLLMVLPKKHYTAAYPIFPGKQRQSGTLEDQDPTAMLFLSKEMDQFEGLKGTGARAITLVVHHDGYYVWTVAYDGSMLERDMRQRLKEHIFHIVGGSFGSHRSGREESASAAVPERASSPRTGTDAGHETLMDYLKGNLGILTFFQINTILEGMYNHNLDPLVFFRSDQTAHKQYSLGGFISKITATFHPAKRPPGRRWNPANEQGESGHEEPEQQSQEEVVAHKTVADFFEAYLNATTDQYQPLVRSFAGHSIYPPARAHILDEFLVVTEVITLKQMKKRIERCRRALLEELIEVTHRRDKLLQAEPPDGPVDRIDDVTEAQLRGYVMLFSAKMPLIANVLLHLEDLHFERTLGRKKGSKQAAYLVASESEELADPESTVSEVYGPFQSWKGLLRALQSDIRSLTDAIDQARTDRMLYEQEQIHAEQETLAEIERLNERTDNSISPAGSVTISVISNILALFAVILASGPLVKNGKVTVDLGGLRSLLDARNVPGELTLVLAVAILIAIYVVVHFGLQRFLRLVFRVFRRDLRLDAKYYYEMDIRVDAPFELAVLPTLFDIGTPADRRRRCWTPHRSRRNADSTAQTLRPQVPGFGIKGTTRNSYRVERLEKSEALHKVYLEADIKISRHRRIHAVLVYELLFHRPAKEHDYIFKDLRVVSTHAKELTLDEIVRFKRIVTERFVNPCLDADWALKIPHEDANDPSDNFDSLFTVTRVIPSNSATMGAS